MSWNHNSGFNVHVGKPIDGADGEAIQRLTRYMSRAALVRRANPLPYREEDRDGGWQKISGRHKELWPVPEFFALLATHIHCRYESLIT